ALTVINEKTGVIITVNQIINKVLKDELLHCKYKSLTSLHAYLSNHCNDKFVLKIIEDYLKINDSNLTARITLLYSLCIYIHTNNIDFNIEMFPQHFWKGFYRIFDYTRLSLNIDARETILLESEIIILLNKIYYDQ
ncbi:MAG: hypothetical protein FWD47_15475, partial [Treponema sp.]|nr:hypothetical protein [Treponema sp.]